MACYVLCRCRCVRALGCKAGHGGLFRLFFHILRRVKTFRLSVLVTAHVNLAFSCYNARSLFCPPMLSGHTTRQRLPPLCFSGHFKLTIIQFAVPLRSC